MYSKRLITLQNKNQKCVKIKRFLNKLLKKHHIDASTVHLFVNNNNYINGYSDSSLFINDTHLVFTKGDIEKLSYQENCTLLAHEVGHIVHDYSFYSSLILCIISVFELIVVDNNISTTTIDNSKYIFDFVVLMLLIIFIQAIIIYSISDYYSEYSADRFACKICGKRNFKALILRIHTINFLVLINLKRKLAHLKLTPLAYLHAKFLLFYAKLSNKLDLVHTSWKWRLHRLNIKL